MDAQRVQPLDPLTPEELTTAERVARADSSVLRLVGGRRSVMGSVSFLALKPDAPDTVRPVEVLPQRTAVVLFYVYDGDYGVRALVDLTAARVRQADRVEREPIPFAAEEVTAAQRLALSDPGLREKVGREQYHVEWLGFTAADERDPCYRHRCLQLFFRRGRAFLMRPNVIVDLTAQQVRLEEP